jgi:transcription termination factor Rho
MSGGREAAGAKAPIAEPHSTAEKIEASGVLELVGDGGGYLRQSQRSFRQSPDDVFVPRAILDQLASPHHGRNAPVIEGCEIIGLAIPDAGGHGNGGSESQGHRRSHRARGQRRGSRHASPGRSPAAPRLTDIKTVNGVSLEEFSKRLPFPSLTSIDPFEKIRLETDPEEISMRVIDILTPIGKGQRCLIVAPPRAGKTTLLQKMAAAISHNHPEIHLMVLLVDERPEEVTDMKRSVRGEVIASSSDDMARQHVSVARIVLERARRFVELGRDVVILLDSLTRLARAHNAATPGTGRTLSGGLDARTMEQPRRLFGAARKAEEGGSLTVIATALIDTGSRMDDVIFQEFKGTGNMELVLDRALFEQRIYPAVDIAPSGTRKEEKLFSREDLSRIHKLRRVLFDMKARDAMAKLIDKLSKYPTNADFLKAIDA